MLLRFTDDYVGETTCLMVLVFFRGGFHRVLLSGINFSGETFKVGVDGEGNL